MEDIIKSVRSEIIAQQDYIEGMFVDIEKGGKKAVLGEIRKWADGSYKKTLNGWELVVEINNKQSSIIEQYDGKVEDRYEQRWIDDIKRLEYDKHKSEIAYELELGLFTLHKLINSGAKYPKVQWQDGAVQRGLIKEEDKYENTIIFDHDTAGTARRIVNELKLPYNITMMKGNLTEEEYNVFSKPYRDILSHLKKWKQKEEEFKQKYQ